MLVILDRDGVINEESKYFIKSPDEWLPIPGSLEAIAKLKNAGFMVAVATNQSGIARGLYSEEILSQIHKKMSDALQKLGVRLDAIVYCPHHPKDQCQCRKPAPGLFLSLAEKLQFDMTKAICIGDSMRDIQAAKEVGATPILVLTGNGKKTLTEMSGLKLKVYANLAEAVDHILLARGVD